MSNDSPATMVFPCKIASIIYILLFICVKLFHCIDVSNETITMTEETIGNENENGTYTIDINSSNQTTILNSDVQPQENGGVMLICNRTYPTPRGTVCSIFCCSIEKFSCNTNVTMNEFMLV